MSAALMRFPVLATSTAIVLLGITWAFNAALADDAQKLDSEKLERKLQDTRDAINRMRTPVSPNTAPPEQIIVDICKKNPQLPQCKL